MKKLLIFLAGFVTGVIAVNLYELFGVPAMPDDDYHEWTEDELLGADKPFTPDEIEYLASYMAKLEMDAIASLEETQPISVTYTHNESGDDSVTYSQAYNLDQWAKESE